MTLCHEILSRLTLITINALNIKKVNGNQTNLGTYSNCILELYRKEPVLFQIF